MKGRYFFILSFLLLIGCQTKQRAEFEQAEKLLVQNADSALLCLQQLDPSELKGEEAARYALLYSEALDKKNILVTNDSLISIATNYYQHPETEEEALYFYRALFQKGKIKLNIGDRFTALRYFLRIESKLKDTSSSQLGLVCVQLGKIYYQQMNYNRALQYYQEARLLFRKDESLYEETEATLDVGASYFRLKALERAVKYYSHALYMADEYHFPDLGRIALSNLAALYMRWKGEKIPEELLRRIEKSARQDTINGYRTLLNVKILKNELDSIGPYWHQAEKQVHNIHDQIDLEYTAFRVAMENDYNEKAIQHIHRFVFLNDSLTRANMQFSAGMIERAFFREHAKLGDYRMHTRMIWEYVLIGVSLLILFFSYMLFRHRIRTQRIRTEHYLYLAEEAKAQYNELMQHMTTQKNQEAMLKGLVAKRFDVIDYLGKNYYEREGTSSQQSSIFQQVKKIITDFSERDDIFQELEKNVNICHDNAMEKLRSDFPNMKEADLRLLCYGFVGFSPQIISLFMKDSIANIYARKSRIKTRIKASDSPNKDLYMSLFK
ncbi:tetratricopeptide repeat protein [gut metagenome]|uniref:Tetratricopeptide repeat protein n=1 Tax=gut metagenome TaxID=749906 RepID=J9GPU8_9ZZZZ